jgi:hypothetical protein
MVLMTTVHWGATVYLTTSGKTQKTLSIFNSSCGLYNTADIF